MVTDISFPPMAVVDFKIMTPLTDVNDEIPHLDDLQDSCREQSDLDDPDFIESDDWMNDESSDHVPQASSFFRKKVDQKFIVFWSFHIVWIL